MQYIYCFANASLVLRLMTYLSKQVPAELASVTVIYLVDRWVVRIKLRSQLPTYIAKNFESFLNENAYPFNLSVKDSNALIALDGGASIEAVTASYQMVIVSHGSLRPEDIEAFRATFTSRLGYCPPSLV